MPVIDIVHMPSPAIHISELGLQGKEMHALQLTLGRPRPFRLSFDSALKAFSLSSHREAYSAKVCTCINYNFNLKNLRFPISNLGIEFSLW